MQSDFSTCCRAHTHTFLHTRFESYDQYSITLHYIHLCSMHMYTISMGICHRGQAMPHSQTSSKVQTPSVESKRSFRHHMPSLCQVMICNWHNWHEIEINRHPSMRGHRAGATSQHLSVISHRARSRDDHVTMYDCKEGILMFCCVCCVCPMFSVIGGPDVEVQEWQGLQGEDLHSIERPTPQETHRQLQATCQHFCNGSTGAFGTKAALR